MTFETTHLTQSWLQEIVDDKWLMTGDVYCDRSLHDGHCVFCGNGAEGSMMGIVCCVRHFRGS